jgi:hypothetical protein
MIKLLDMCNKTNWEYFLYPVSYVVTYIFVTLNPLHTIKCTIEILIMLHSFNVTATC